MGIKTVPHPPDSPDLDPCDFWLFPKLRGCRYETTEEMKEVVTRSHKSTSLGPSRSCSNGTTSVLQPEEITSKGTRVSCVYYHMEIRPDRQNEMQFLPGSSRIDTDVWMHYFNAN